VLGDEGGVSDLERRGGTGGGGDGQVGDLSRGRGPRVSLRGDVFYACEAEAELEFGDEGRPDVDAVVFPAAVERDVQIIAGFGIGCHCEVSEILRGENEGGWKGRENGMRGMHISSRDSTRLPWFGLSRIAKSGD